MKNSARIRIIAIAVVWAAVILSVGIVLEGSPHATPVITLVAGGTAATLIILGAWLKRSSAH